MLCYLFDDAMRTGTDDSPPFEDWTRGWSTTDESNDSPRQTNGYDCGVFTLLTMYLLMQGVTITSSTYTQNTVYHKDVRRRLAYRIWLSSSVPRPPTGLTDWLQDPHGTPLGPGRQATAKAKAAAPPALQTTAKKRRKRKSDHSITLGRTRVRRQVTFTIMTGTRDTPLENRKRSAASLAEENRLAETTQRQLPEKKRKRNSQM